MAILDVIQLGNFLRQKSAPVTSFDEELRLLVANMTETMNQHGGWGLAAIQVCVPQQVLVISPLAGDANGSPLPCPVMINPVILDRAGEIETMEACLSLRGVTARVKRANEVYVQFQDVAGKEHKMVVMDNLAVVVQHESDHLHGMLFIDHIGPVRRRLITEKFQKMARQHERSEARFHRLSLEEQVQMLQMRKGVRAQ